MLFVSRTKSKTALIETALTEESLYFLPGWSGAEIKCTVHVDLPVNKLDNLNWISKVEKKAIKAYCPLIYMYVLCSPSHCYNGNPL